MPGPPLAQAPIPPSCAETAFASRSRRSEESMSTTAQDTAAINVCVVSIRPDIERMTQMPAVENGGQTPFVEGAASAQVVAWLLYRTSFCFCFTIFAGNVIWLIIPSELQ